MPSSDRAVSIDATDEPADHDADCIFCRHADRTVNSVVHRLGTMYARWDNFPASRGHMEIVPFRHVLSFFDMTSEETRDMHALAKEMRHLLESEYQPDGFTIGVNDGSAAGRTVPHLHLHIIPRWHGDVADPRGGIRRVFGDCDPEAWLQPASGLTATASSH
ncbi:HIT family protein [Nocardia sp. NPDC059240]|uniref:HIT family protein n=1 Tax=Nocardia sp. NPDC059240 TaxID=3346786 RepID=UPI003694DB62